MKIPFSKIFLFSLISVLIFFLWKNKNLIKQYFKVKKSYTISATYKDHHEKIFKSIKDYSFGIDVSEYQGNIDWENLKTIDGKKNIDFIIIRATAGKNKLDYKFKKNWKKASQYPLVLGAYHYYRPNENSREQAQNFINNVKLSSGDFPPILDIEKLPQTQSIDSLKVGLKRWLTIVEEHYKVKPIIYSGESYYYDFLKNEFSEYQFWIANYNLNINNHPDDCIMWQFSEKGSANGINTPLDLNVFNGNLKKLKKILIP